MNKNGIKLGVTLLLATVLLSFKTTGQSTLTWDKCVGKKKASEAKEFFSVLVQMQKTSNS